MSAEHAEGHGSTPAAWTAVTIIFLGSVVAGWAVVVGSAALGAVAAVVAAGGVVAGKAMQMMGMGKG